MSSNVSTWLNSALQQMAAESYRDDLDQTNPAILIRRLKRGHTDTLTIDPDVPPNPPVQTRFTAVLVECVLGGGVLEVTRVRHRDSNVFQPWSCERMALARRSLP